ncbi:unnamed protein product, partial [Owenia fusiformis]
ICFNDSSQVQILSNTISTSLLLKSAHGFKRFIFEPMAKYDFIILLVCIHGCLSMEWSANDTANLDQFIATTMECRNVPGMFLTIVKDDEVTLSRGYGFKNVETKEPFTTQTP